MFNIADKYSGQLGMNTRQCLSIPSPYIMSQPVTDPETELGVGQPTWNLYGRLRQPSFMTQFFRTSGGMPPSSWPLDLLLYNNLFSQQISANHSCPPLYKFLDSHLATFSEFEPPVAKSERE